MQPGPALENLIAAIATDCRSGLEPAALRQAVLPRLRRAVPIDALWWATADPGTLLFTETYREAIPADTGAYFVENEFLRDDVNKWVDVARSRTGVATLLDATAGRADTSPRFRDVFQPLGLGDELRVALRARGATWGFMCLHREHGSAFSRDEIGFVQRIAPHVADGIRLGLLVPGAGAREDLDPPGLIVLGPGNEILATNDAGDRWMEELGAGRSDRPPIAVLGIAARLRSAPPTGLTPRLRVRTAAGNWALLQASWMRGDTTGSVAVIVEQASAQEVAPIAMAAFGLTAQECAVAGLVFHGLSTRLLSHHLRISEHTVQDHLKSIFDKTGVRSRRELVATVLRQRYLPRAQAGERPGRSGYFPDGPNR